MEYEPIFKFPEYNIFMTDLFLQNYWKFNPIAIIKNGRWEMFLSKEVLKEIAKKGYNYALQNGFFTDLEEQSEKMITGVLELAKEDIESKDKKSLLEFAERLYSFAKRFLEKYNLTEFIYFTKIEKELEEYLGEQSFQDLMSGNIEIANWPEKERKLADYIISVQHLKFKLRKVINEIFIGPQAVIPRFLIQLVVKTEMEDSINMTLSELKECLNNKEVKDVSDRKVYSYITWDDKNQKMLILSGGDAYRKIRELEKQIPKNEVIGQPACKGIVQGKAKIIPLSMNPEKYLSKMEKGDILVSDTTGPELMPAIEKAAAIVTDEGGMMSHAAIISREFNTPCVVGTKYATKVFKDGDLIEVNANNGIVKKI